MEANNTTLEVLVNDFAEAKKSYFGQWTFEKPFVISAQEDQLLNELQNVLRKLIRGFVLNYDRWAYLMPVNKDCRRVIDAFQAKPYKCGSYRVDTVFDGNRQQKIIETTCRFALNGYFIAGLFNYYAQQYKVNNPTTTPTINRFTSFFPFLMDLIGQHRKLIVLKDTDGRNASKIYLPLFEKMGFELLILNPEEINHRVDEISGGFLISELTIKQVENLSDEVLEVLVGIDMINDLRTVVLIHDKRFYDVLGRDEIRNTYLTKSEIELLDTFYVPTYRHGASPDEWKLARRNKNNWILKHRSLGKSQDVFSGTLCTETEWTELFKRTDINQFIVQRWVEQPRFRGVVNGVEVEDYVTGTLLYFDNHYFGTGIFRTSSCPVSNKTDDRKMFGITLGKPETANSKRLVALNNEVIR